MCSLAKFLVPCNEKLENFVNVQKGDTIMLEFLSDPSGPRLKTNHTSLSLSTLAESWYDTCIIIQLRHSKPIMCSHHCTLLFLSLLRTKSLRVTKRLELLSPYIVFMMMHSHRYVFFIYTVPNRYTNAKHIK